MNQIKDELEISATYDKIIKLQNKYTNRELSLHLKIAGEKVVATQIKGEFCNSTYYENSIEKNSWKNSLSIIKNLPTTCPIHHQILLVRSFENMLKDFEGVPYKAKYIRSIMLELERIQCHLSDLAFLGLGLSYPVFYTRMMKLKLKITELINQISNNDLSSFIIFGGISYDFSDEIRNSFFQLIDLMTKKMKITIRNLQRNIILKNILRDVGFIARETAKNLSLVGPMARSSGITHDVRKSDPYGAYGDVEFNVPVSDFCDVYGEYLVKCEEILQSLKIISQLLSYMPNEAYSVDLKQYELGANSRITRVEGPTGELFVFSQSKKGTADEKPRLYKITTSMKLNSQGVLSRITGEQISNIKPILLAIGEGWKL